jgi:hypothetical protein
MLFELDSRPALVASAALLGASFAVALAVTPDVPVAAVDVPRIAVQMKPLSSNGVIVPPDFRDAQPWPRGMVIAPPDTGDRMRIPDSPLSGLLGSVAEALRSTAGRLL